MSTGKPGTRINTLIAGSHRELHTRRAEDVLLGLCTELLIRVRLLSTFRTAAYSPTSFIKHTRLCNHHYREDRIFLSPPKVPCGPWESIAPSYDP